MERKFIVTYSDFSGGDYGRSFPKTAADLPTSLNTMTDTNPTTKIAGVNVWHYSKGIGPRPPFILFTPTSPLPAKSTIFATAIGFKGNAAYILLSDKHLYNLKTGADLGASPAADPTTYTANPAASQGAQGIAITTEATKGFQYDPFFGLVANTALPVGDIILTFGPHFVVLDKANTKMSWSTPNTSATWPAAQFQPLAGTPGDMVIQKNSLILGITYSGSPMYDLYAITGTLSVNAVFRRIDAGMGYAYHGDASSATPFSAHGAPMVSVGGDFACWINKDKLVTFAGAELTVEDFALPRLLSTNATQLGATHTLPVWRIISDPNPNAFWVFGSETTTGGGTSTARTAIVLYRDTNGSWWPMDVGITYRTDTRATTFNNPEYYANSIHPQPSLFGFIYHDAPLGTQYLELITGGRGTATTQAPKQYRMSLLAQSPDGTSSDGDTAAPVTAEMRTVDWYADHNWQCAVRSVTVDYVATGTGTEGFTLAVEAINPSEDLGTTSSTSQAFSVPSTSGETAYSGAFFRGRKTFDFYDQGASQGWRLFFSGWKGVMIEKITVEGDLMDARI